MTQRYLDDDNVVYIPNTDVCAFCGDSECGGIGCIASLDPDKETDHPEIERLHQMLRAGAAFLAANEALADAENRRPWWKPVVQD